MAHRAPIQTSAIRRRLTTIAAFVTLALSITTTQAVVRPASTSPTPTKTTTTSIKNTTLANPTPTIPAQCSDCNIITTNTTAETVCFHSTQCVKADYFCDEGVPDSCLANGIIDPSDSSATVTCQQGLCYPSGLIPIAAPGTTWLSPNYCQEGQFFGLINGLYTQVCLTLTQTGTAAVDDCDLKKWEYCVQGVSLLNTCTTANSSASAVLSCAEGYECVAAGNGVTNYGTCQYPGGGAPSSSSSDDGTGNGDGTTRISSSDLLLQGILVGVGCLLVGICCGAGFWHCKRRKRGFEKFGYRERSQSQGSGSGGGTGTGRSDGTEDNNDGRNRSRSIFRNSNSLFGPRRRTSHSRSRNNNGEGGEGDRDSVLSDADSTLSGSQQQQQQQQLEHQWQLSRTGRVVDASRRQPSFANIHSLHHNTGVVHLVPEFEPPPLYDSGTKAPEYIIPDSDEDADSGELEGSAIAMTDLGVSSAISLTSSAATHTTRVTPLLTHSVPSLPPTPSSPVLSLPDTVASHHHS